MAKSTPKSTPKSTDVEPKASAKATVKATVKAKAPKDEIVATTGKFGVERDHDLPWNEKKVSVFKALKALGAVSASTAVSASAAAEKGSVSPRDVRHYCYHAKAAGLVNITPTPFDEGGRGYGFHLTAKGAKLNPAAELKAQQKTREA